MLADSERVSTLELEAAGPALGRYAARRIREGAQSRIVEMVGGNLDAVFWQGGGRGCPAGRSAGPGSSRALGKIVGYAIASMMHLFIPSIFVVGGGVTSLGELLFKPMREAARAPRDRSRLLRQVLDCAAALGEDVAIIGAAVLAFQSLQLQVDYTYTPDEGRILCRTSCLVPGQGAGDHRARSAGHHPVVHARLSLCHRPRPGCRSLGY